MSQREYQQELKRVQLPTIWTIPDTMWQRIRPLLPPEKDPGTPGRPPVPFRKVMDGILFVLRTAAVSGKLFLVATAPVRPPIAALSSG
jgi:hypothetical protein